MNLRKMFGKNVVSVIFTGIVIILAIVIVGVVYLVKHL